MRSASDTFAALEPSAATEDRKPTAASFCPLHLHLLAKLKIVILADGDAGSEFRELTERKRTV